VFRLDSPPHFARSLIAQARELYAGEELGIDLTDSVYALDSTTIDLCMSVFPWAHFRSTKSAAYSTPFGHAFHQHPASHSTHIRPPVP